jgi:Antitoxin Xre/MbcA/ParS C-terminal toxin-binding domain/Antitoxin Xre-like helix-turn-helix domain
MARIRPRAQSATTEAVALSKATIRAADRLDVNNRTLAAIIGLSEPSITRLKRGEFTLERGQKPFELSALFVRLYRSLDAIVSGDEHVARTWLRNENTALRGVPLDLIQTISGLVNVIQYLDARRAVV